MPFAKNLVRAGKVPEMHLRSLGRYLEKFPLAFALLLLLFFLGLEVRVSGEPLISSLVSPADGATQDETSLIAWSVAPEAEFYSLWVGTSKGSNDLYQTGETLATSIRVPDVLPRNQLLFARHQTKIKGSWLYRDSSFVIGAPAQLITPKGAGKLSATTPEFVWSSVPAADAYRLSIGPVAGAEDYYFSKPSIEVHAKVDGLPLNRTLHVRLRTQIAGTWLHRDSTVVILRKARLANPSTNGVIELRATDLLKWEPVENVDRYYLWVGSKPGQSDIYNSGETSGTSASIKNAPWDTPLYLRLWTQVEGRWEDYEDAIIQFSNLTRTDKGSNRYTGSPPLLFTSWEFVCLFLPLVLMIHRWLGYGRAAVGFLVIASFFWYSVWDWRFGPLILLSLTANWWGARRLERTKQRWFYIALLLLNLTPLLYFKYIRFFFSVAGTQPDDWLRPEFIPHLLPLGISFFTFQKLAYVTDIYRGKPAEQSWLRFSFFVLFFPQLVAGPITHHSQILPQLRKEPEDREGLFLAGCIYFLIGFAKKRFGADMIAAAIDPYFISGVVQYADQSLVATFGYTLQLYFDFSGYSDMAVGIAALFGFRLPWNFNSPYKATSFSDFWQRWHITLSAFLREYVYFPLGGNRVAPLRRYFNLFATMVIGGFWHGAGWAFIIWGAGHGVLLCAQHLLGEKRWSAIPALFRHFTVFIAVAILWIPFRTENLSLTGEILRSFLNWRPLDWQPIYGYGLAGLAVVWFTPNSHAIASFCRPRLTAAAHYTWALGGRVGWYAVAGLLITSAAITSFYRDAPDIWLRRHLPMASESDSVRHDAGDLRTNINRAAILSAPGEKWVVAGPSYTRGMGLFTWQHMQKTISVGSVGIGGQSFSHWIRIPLAVLHDPEVRRLYIACSPIGLFAPTPLGNEAVFATQGADALDLIGIRSPSRSHSSLFGEPMSFIKIGWDTATLQLRGPQYFQLQGTALTVAEHLSGRIVSPVPVPLNETDLLAAARTIEALKQQALVSPKSPDDLSNGANARFNWESRGLIEAISRNGGTDQALGRLIAIAKQHEVQIILYETPTLKNQPGIYPAHFYERYQMAMNDLAKRHGVDYIDLSGLFPEDGNSMHDFCHPHFAHQPLILKTLINRTKDE